MTRMSHQGTWQMKYVAGTDYPYRIIYTTKTGRECDIEGFHSVEAATRALNEIFAVESNRQPVFIA